MDEQFIEEIKKEARKIGEKVGVQLAQKEFITRAFNELPVPTIARIMDLPITQVLEEMLEIQCFETGQNPSRKPDSEKPPKEIFLLDEPINKVKIPTAISTKKAIERHQNAIERLKQRFDL